MKFDFLNLAWLRQEARIPDPPNVTVPQWLVDSAKAAGWLAMATLIYFLFIFTLDIAGDQAEPLHITHAGFWTGDIKFFVPLIGGFLLIAVGVPFFAKIIIPIFISLDWRTNLWPKAWSLVLVLAFSFVVFAGTFSVQGKTIMEHGRGAAVAVAEVNNGRAAIQAEIDGIDHNLQQAFNNPNRIMAQAASVGALGGAEAWERGYVAQARRTNDPRLPLLERATGAAQAAHDATVRQTQLRQQLAAAPVAESVQATVTTAGTSWIASTLDWLVGARAILLSLVMDVVCLLMPWIALRLEQTRNRQLGQAEDAYASRWPAVPDMSSPDKPGHMSREDVKQNTVPMDANYKGDLLYDETGAEMAWVAGHVRPKDGKWIPGHYRKTGSRRKQEIAVEYEGRSFKAGDVVEKVRESGRPAQNSDGILSAADEQQEQPEKQERHETDTADDNNESENTEGALNRHSDSPSDFDLPDLTEAEAEEAYGDEPETAPETAPEAEGDELEATTLKDQGAEQAEQAAIEQNGESTETTDQQIDYVHDEPLVETTALTPPGYYDPKAVRARAYRAELEELEAAK